MNDKIKQAINLTAHILSDAYRGGSTLLVLSQVAQTVIY